MPSEGDLEQELLKSVLETSGDTGAVHSFSRDDIRLLPWDRFEALVALLEEKRGSKTLLTPRAGDDKADVLAVADKQLRIVQCKHSLWEASLDSDVLSEVIGAMEIYRARYLRGLPRDVNVQPVVVTNGAFTHGARDAAQPRDVELVGGPELWSLLEETPCTPAEVEAMEARRLASMGDVQAAIKSLVS